MISTEKPRNETALTHAVLQAVQSMPNVFSWRANTGVRGGVRFGSPGQPDIMGVVGPNGTMFGIEIKLPGNKPSKEQQEWHNMAIARGAKVWVATSVEEAIEPLMRLACRQNTEFV